MNAALAQTDWAFRSPSTVVTNLVVATQAVILVRRLLPGARYENVRPWLFFFAWMAIAALAGAVKHGEIGSRPVMWYWAVVVSNTAVVVASAFAELITVRTLIRNLRVRAWLERIIIAQIGVVFVTTVVRPDFLPAFVATVLGLTPVLLVESLRSLRDRPGASAIASGFALTAMGGLAYAFRISLAPWLNYIDIAHLFTVASLALIYRGVLERAGPDLAGEVDGADAAADADGRGWSWLGT
ncbi:MAG: hypothetical protein PVH00_07065 [Gemmatimonadota bacterium]|jgi:hypothetical protein